MVRAIGYFVCFIGIIVLLTSVPPVKELAIDYLPLLSSVHNFFIIGVGLVIMVIGVSILRASSFRGGGRQTREVPIYHGRNIVGYRRG